jgi:Resolvase, N terminal domain/Recombinase
MTEPTCDIYVRLSEDAHGNELGVDRQIEECREDAQRRGWTVRKVWVDNDLSATTGVERPAFEGLLVSDPQRIVCWHSDRFVRLSSDLERVIALNVNVYAIHTGHLDLSTPAGRAVARTVTAWAQYEGEQKALRQKAAHRQRINAGGMTQSKNGKPGRPWWPTRPLGFNLDGSHHEVEAPALRQAYADLLGGGTIAASVRYLESLGIVTARSEKPWKASSLRPALLNARNAGIYVYNGEEIGKAAWDPIVSEEVYRAVARILTDPSRKTYDGDVKVGFGHRANLLTGFAVCDKCDHTVRAAWRRSAGVRTYKVYQCGGCHGTTLPSEWADSVVGRKVIEHVELWRDRLPSGAESSESVADLRTEEAALESRKAELGELFIEGLVGRKALAAGTARADARLSEIKEQLADRAVKATGAYFWDPESLWTWLDDGEGGWDVEKFRPVIERVCSSIRFVGPGRGRKDLHADQHVLIEYAGRT